MTTKEQHIANAIRERIINLNPKAEVVLFGSHARGEANRKSDWDILILLDSPDVSRETEKKYREELFDLELEIGEPFSTFVFSKNDWERRHAATPFYQNIQNDGILLT